MKIKPLFDRILIKEISPKQETKSGLILPSSTQEKPLEAEVIATGCGGKVDGDDVKIIVKVGDKILFNKYSANEFCFGSEKLLIIKQCDILAIVED